TIHWELDELAQEASSRLVALVRERGLPQRLTLWRKEQQLERMRASGHFRFTREVALHRIEYGGAGRYLEMMRSAAFRGQFTLTDRELGPDRLTQAAFEYIGSEPIPWYVSYRARIGVK